MTENEAIIEELHHKLIDLQHKIVELENSRVIVKQDKLLAFKFLPGNERFFLVSGNINGLLTLIRTLTQSLVTYGHTRQKIDTLKFPHDTLTNSDYFLSGINVVDDFFEIEKIKVYEPTTKDKANFWASYLCRVIWRLIKFSLMVLGIFYIIEYTIFK